MTFAGSRAGLEGRPRCRGNDNVCVWCVYIQYIAWCKMLRPTASLKDLSFSPSSILLSPFSIHLAVAILHPSCCRHSPSILLSPFSIHLAVAILHPSCCLHPSCRAQPPVLFSCLPWPVSYHSLTFRPLAPTWNLLNPPCPPPPPRPPRDRQTESAVYALSVL